jgi:membrane-bound serine protease (ClpP class)
MLKLLLKIFITIFLTSPLAYANQALLLNLDGAIGPAAQSYIINGLKKAAAEHDTVIVLSLDTPGGLGSAMHTIDNAILASPVPVVTYVAPRGAQAASAGTFILYASHIAAMAPGTEVGSSTPVNASIYSPASPEKSKIDQSNLSTPEKKRVNSAVASIRSLAEVHGRNASWAEDAVRNAVSITADVALQQKVIDVIAESVPDLLQKINGRSVTVNGVTQILDTKNITTQNFVFDWRYQLLSTISNPNIAYILLLIGIYGLFFEFIYPGLVLPGVAGTIALLLALYAFQLLPVNYVGFSLLLLGIAFMIIEVLISSFGILGVGGIVAFVTGSILLLDVNSPGYQIAWSLIAGMTAFTLVFFLILITLAIRAHRKKIVTGQEALLGSQGVVLNVLKNKHYQVRIEGEIWEAKCAADLRTGQKIKIRGLSGLVLEVTPLSAREDSVEE